MPIDNDAARRADKNRDWAKISPPGQNGGYAITLRFVRPSKPNAKAIASRVQRAAAEALAALRRQRED